MNLCKKGLHDLDVVGYYQHRRKTVGHTKPFRECKQCKHERSEARKHRKTETPVKRMTPGDVERALELRVRAECLPHWQREALIREAVGLEEGR
tara:strand:+ start:2546 stop:2827 length:282 start_codon:yes stop_codon:yes gene_type:complete